ncbi:MAG: NINE protein [Saprospiraceae bacterium]|nr:NINE protein [Saprospiraceae bacterium]
METQQADLYLLTSGKFYASHHIPFLRDRLLQMDESRWFRLQTLSLKDPTMMLVVSIVAGTFGIDRFLIGDIGLGLGKLLTLGGCGIWTFIDFFLIMDATKEKNLAQFNQACI